MTMPRHKYRRFGNVPRQDWYINKKRRHRQKRAVSMRWRICKDVDGMGVFSTHQYIPGSKSWMEDGGSMEDDSHIMSWADFYFMSKKPIKEGIFYNASVITVAKSIVEDIESEIYDKVDNMLTKEERQKEADSWKNRFNFKKVPGKKYYTLDMPQSMKFESLGGRSKREVEIELYKEELDNLWKREAKVSYKKDYSYRNGVGLHIVTGTPGITVSTIISMIEEFWSNGEEDIEYNIDITPHIPAIRAMLYNNIAINEIVIAKEKGEAYTPPDFDTILSDEEKRYFHNGSVPIKSSFKI